ncbi:hypothetical protein SCHPADRAFT_591907 [Schizopora paradoxa]|uniref:C2H2-type domain-containing protein n=1 Tax=Schizopora paradoxa TaxID=27342 RepID=A0A0H2RAJ6_9AGAM|nr:hypothetical protein SCHPADRAFT_591907 [Schizopora paradoxa]
MYDISNFYNNTNTFQGAQAWSGALTQEDGPQGPTNETYPLALHSNTTQSYSHTQLPATGYENGFSFPHQHGHSQRDEFTGPYDLDGDDPVLQMCDQIVAVNAGAPGASDPYTDNLYQTSQTVDAAPLSTQASNALHLDIPLPPQGSLHLETPALTQSSSNNSPTSQFIRTPEDTPYFPDGVLGFPSVEEHDAAQNMQLVAGPSTGVPVTPETASPPPAVLYVPDLKAWFAVNGPLPPPLAPSPNTPGEPQGLVQDVDEVLSTQTTSQDPPREVGKGQRTRKAKKPSVTRTSKSDIIGQKTPRVRYPCTFSWCTKTYAYEKDIGRHIKRDHTTNPTSYFCPNPTCDSNKKTHSRSEGPGLSRKDALTRHMRGKGVNAQKCRDYIRGLKETDPEAYDLHVWLLP